ncbi:cystathionine beta-lyase [Hyphobacterium sp. HN65]|uniref:Cystathionine beta-lyase n=1 Tax=Hyphobacterium lacteum TaxID=3116575 RepID=A0ABU7LN23_9PROT|nr:cystathionine beta-lyase [Hyphobacterium sp. HN65]MEE2524994.1 cystathionine beta-lyase [Hyphobacterium sp. HN65]
MKRDTQLTRAGRSHHGTRPVNAAIQRASTVLAGEAKDLYNRPDGIPLYARFGMESQNALKSALCEMQAADYCALTPSGLSAMTLATIACVSNGGHVLAADCLYGPTRMFLSDLLPDWGVKVEYFDPRIGGGISQHIRENTQLVFCESPGSLTFEVQDIPAISAAAHKVGARVLVDDTWSAGLNANMLDLGADYAAQSLTKYAGGHSDVIMGAVLCRGDNAERLKGAEWRLGLCVSPDDAFLVSRGLRTLGMRMDKSGAASIEIAERLAERPEVSEVLHPARADHPDHAIYTRDFSAPAGVFGVQFKDWDIARSERFLDALEIFGLGFSWGGFESLAVHCDPQLRRNFRDQRDGALIRLAIGLEDVDDLWNDLEQAIRASA